MQTKKGEGVQSRSFLWTSFTNNPLFVENSAKNLLLLDILVRLFQDHVEKSTANEGKNSIPLNLLLHSVDNRNAFTTFHKVAFISTNLIILLDILLYYFDCFCLLHLLSYVLAVQI